VLLKSTMKNFRQIT